MSGREWSDAHVVKAALDVHANDPMFGYRFITDELHGQGITVSENRVQRLCQEHHIWSLFAKKHGLSRKPCPLVHDYLLRRKLFAVSPNIKWLTNITEHPTDNGKLYVYVVKDVWLRRIVGYSIKDRMTSDLAVCAINNIVAIRGTYGTIVHSDRGSQGEFNRSFPSLRDHVDKTWFDQINGTSRGVCR